MPKRLTARDSRFRNVLLCDDIRRELFGKRTIVGVFSGDIVLSEAPTLLPLATYIEFVPESAEENEIEFRFIIGDDDTALLKATLEKAEVGRVAVLDLPKIAIQLEGPTEIAIEARVKGRNPDRIVTKRVLIGDLS